MESMLAEDAVGITTWDTQMIKEYLFRSKIIAVAQKGEPMNDLISRQAAIDALKGLPTWWADEGGYYGEAQPPMVALLDPEDAVSAIENLPSAHPEPLTDKEQRIFLAAMGREEKVCKQVDEECRDCREAYGNSLVKTCHEIIRKVKCALWT